MRAPFLSGSFRAAFPEAQREGRPELSPRIPSREPLLLTLFCRGQEAEFEVDVSEYLGPLLFVRLSKWHLLQDDAWFCNWISVQGPGASGDQFRFPCYRWLEGKGILSLPEGAGEQRGGAWGCARPPGAREKLGVGERRRGRGLWGSRKRRDAGAGTEQHGDWGCAVMLKGQGPAARAG